MEQETKDKGPLVDISSVLADMASMEEYGGRTEAKIYEHWHTLKRELTEALAKTEKK